MVANLVIWFPAPAAMFAAFLAITVAYLLYSVAKVVISLWTGA